MEVRILSLKPDLEVCQAAQCDGERGLIGSEYSRIGIQTYSACQQVFVLLDESWQARRADFFFALKHELQIQRQMRGVNHGLQRFENGDELAFHI